MLSTRLGHGLPALLAIALADDFCLAVSFLDLPSDLGRFLSQIAFFIFSFLLFVLHATSIVQRS